MESLQRYCAAISIAIFAASCMTPSFAADGSYSNKYEACARNATSTLDSQACIAAEMRIQDTRLNDAYKEVIKDLSAPRAKQLLEVQRLWLKFRDANCAFYMDPDGGTLAPVLASMCRLQLTTTRAKELEDLLTP